MFGHIRHAPLLDWGVSQVLSTQRDNMCVGKFADGRAVFCGGVQDDPQLFQSSTDTLVFAVDGLSHVSGAAMPTTMSNIEGALLGDGRLLFVGNAFGDTLTLEPSGLTWTTQPSSPTAAGGSRTVTLPSGNALKIGGNLSVDVEEYNYMTNAWTTRPSMVNGRSFPAVVVMSNGKVLVAGGGSSVVEIYDPIAQIWSSTANTLQAQNNGNAAIALPNGKVMLCNSVFTGPLYTIFTDIYNPISNKFKVAASGLQSWQGATSEQTFSPLFNIGDGYVVLMAFGSQSRESYYDSRLNKWEERVPEYPERWRGSYVQLDKNTILSVGGEPGFAGGEGAPSIPHFSQNYVLRGTNILNNKTAPTFGGVVSVDDGNRVGKAVVSWTPATDDRTHQRDINYFVYTAATSGGQVYTPPGAEYANTTGWAGSSTIELFNLIPSANYYIVVRARDMVAKESYPNETTVSANYDQNTTELLYVPPSTIAAPTFNWTATTSMSEARYGCKAIQLATSAVGANGDNGRVMIAGGRTSYFGSWSATSDIYAQDGLTRDYGTFTQPATDFAVIHGSPTNGDSLENRRAQIIGGGTNSLNWNSINATRYYQYLRAWFPNDGYRQAIPDMLEAVRNHAAIGVDTHGILVFGGIAAPDNSTAADVDDTTNKVQRLEYDYGTRAFYASPSGTFTVGNAITGSISGASGTVFKVNTGFQPYVEISNVTGFFQSGDILNDGSATATATFIQFNAQLQKWVYKTAMAHKRLDHQVIELNDGRILIAGGKDAWGFSYSLPVRDLELYTPSTDTYTRIYGWNLNYDTQTVNWTLNNFIGGVTSLSVAKIQVDVDSGATGTIKFSNFWNGSDGTSWNDIPFVDGEVLHDTNFVFDWSTVGGSQTFQYNGYIVGDTSGATANIRAFPSTALNSNFVFGDTNGCIITDIPVGTFIPGEGFIAYTQFAVPSATGFVGSVTGNGVGNAAASNSTVEVTRLHRRFPAVKLLDGKILLISGQDETPNYAVDIFDPSGDTVTHAADIAVSRKDHTAHVFGDGSVGVFGGYSADAGNLATNAVELYDPVGDAWTTEMSMSVARAEHASILLANNRVLVAGGLDDSFNALNSAEISDT